MSDCGNLKPKPIFAQSSAWSIRKEKLWPEKEKTSENARMEDGRHGTKKEGIRMAAFSMVMSMPESILTLSQNEIWLFKIWRKKTANADAGKCS